MSKTIPGAATPLSGSLVKDPLDNAPEPMARQKRLKTTAHILRDETNGLYEAVRQKRAERDAAKGALATAEFNGAPNIAEIHDDYEARCEEFKALQDRLEASQARSSVIEPIVASVDKFLGEAKRDGRTFRDAKVEPRADVREELEALEAERKVIMELPVPLEDAKEQRFRWVDKQASEGRPRAFWRVDDILQSRGKYLVHKYAAFDFPRRDVPNAARERMDRDVFPSADNAIALLCWLEPERMKAHFAAELERLYAHLDRPGMTHYEKQEALAELDEKIVRLQMAECAWAFAQPELRLRAGVDPGAVLGVVDA